MKRIIGKISDYWEKLGRSIYLGDKTRSGYGIEIWVGLVMMVTGAIMTGVNIATHKGFVTYTTAAIFFAGIGIVFCARVLRKKTPAILIALFVCLIIFTWYAVSGTNEGFAILWIMLVPLAFSYFGDVRFGVLLSIYYEVLLIILFYTPLRTHMSQFYTETFMDRFPVLYLCGATLNSIAMVQYHLSNIIQNEYEKELKEAVNAAVKADNAKSEFLAQMSHEIRTPINAVLGMNEMILRESKDKEILEYAENIDSAGNTLLTIINTILDFSKIEDGKMEIIPIRYDTAAFIGNLVNSIIQRADSKGLKFSLDIDKNLPCAMIGDNVRFSQIIMNLLTNAVKYTEKGSVLLTIRAEEKTADIVRLYVSVKDTGIGIKDEDLGKLFESFERLDEIRNHNIEGTGLGISIVTRLLDMMGSRLVVKSEYGKGSEFSFVIDQKIADETELGDYEKRLAETIKHRDQEDVINAPSARVLLVDDNEMNLKVARNLLRLCGIKPDMVMSGAETVEYMKRKTYDIVFLDHMMPGMDGLETLKKLNDEDLVPENTAMIALTANAVVGAREAYLEAGFLDYLSKPIEMKSLVEKLRTYLPESAYEENSYGNTDPEKESEDAGSGNVKTENTGSEKERNGESEEVLEFGPENDTVLPAKAEIDQKSGTAFKSYDLKSLGAFGIDTEAGIRYSAKDESFYQEMLTDFTDSLEEKLEAIKGCKEAGNLHEYEVLVHALKSNAKMIGATGLFENARAMEEAAKNGDIDHINKNHDNMVATAKEAAHMINRCRSGS